MINLTGPKTTYRMNNNEIIGRNIKLFREKNGISQDVLANYLGVTRVEVSYFENGKRNISTVIIEKAAKLFGIDDYDFYEENTESQQVNVALAFKADFLNKEDLEQIADFRKIILNYLKMKKVAGDE